MATAATLPDLVPTPAAAPRLGAGPHAGARRVARLAGRFEHAGVAGA